MKGEFESVKDASSQLDTAMVLAAGLGTRMRHLTKDRPKPMVELGGRCLIDHVLDRLQAAGIKQAVVNVHYFADLLERHLARRDAPKVSFSSERDSVLDTGGGVRKALAKLGSRPFLIHNSDSVWLERETANLPAMIAAWDDARMDCLLLLADRETSLGYDGRGDFDLVGDNRVRRRQDGEFVPYVFTGVSIAHPRLFENAPSGAFSMNLLWDRAMQAGRLFGIAHDGVWMHVGTPEALADAEARLKQFEFGGT